MSMRYVSPSKALSHADRLAAWKQGYRPGPVTLEWDLSNRCVLGCQDCHFAHTHTRGPWAARDRRLPMAFDPCGDLADGAMVRRALREAKLSGVAGVVWTGGGEPTTHPEWQEIVAYAASQGLRQGIYTLGGLLTRESAAGLARAADWAVVSLDAADGETYAREKGVPAARFEAACDGVRHLAAARAASSATVGVSFLLHGGNWHRADAMRLLARDLGADYATFRPAIRTAADRPAECADDRSWVTEAMPTLEWLAADPFVEVDPSRFASYRDWAGRSYATCHGIKLNATITPDGRMWVCPQKRGVRDALVGDLSKESFAEAWVRHPKQWTDFSQCRVMCRLHLVNEQIEPVFREPRHGAFV